MTLPSKKSLFPDEDCVRIGAMQAKILEIFQSIQGEGQYAGVRQVFVRFFECNMHCAWCDTPASIGDTSRNYKEMTLDEVWQQIQSLAKNCHSVSLTGGEPLLHKDFIRALLPLLKKAKLPVYLDTNGTLPAALKETIDGIDTVAMDIKLPSSTKQKSYWKEHEQFLKIARRKDVFIKTVVTSDTDIKDIEKAARLTAKIDPKIVFILQPNTYELQNGVVKKCLEFHDYCLKYLPNARVLPQTHKFLKVR